MDTMDAEGVEERFITWLKARGTSLHPAVGIHDFSATGEGRGAIALADIPKGTVLFTLRRPPAAASPLLTVGTSKLPAKLTSEEWRPLKQSWTGLILCMMWEEARAKSTGAVDEDSWGPYFDCMPTTFDSSLMFWTAEELAELQASTIKDKIGKEQAEDDYRTLVIPLVKSRPEVFAAPAAFNAADDRSALSFYSLERYHRMGSLVLSRSFHVKADPSAEDDDGSSTSDEGPTLVNGTGMAASAGVDTAAGSGPEINEDAESSDEGSDDEEREDVSDVAMVPLADLLNAKSGHDNARLFYETDCLNMTSTKRIKRGEQIWNTYADPPNSDLLRRYGHVDEQNAFDVVEVGLDFCIGCLAARVGVASPEQAVLQERAEWLVEMGLDDTFALASPTHKDLLPAEFVSALRTLLSAQTDFVKMQEKEKVPKAKVDADCASAAVRIIEARLAEYPTSYEDDVDLLKKPHCQGRLRQAVIVRAGEKRILGEIKAGILGRYLQAKRARAADSDGTVGAKKQRKA